jgi:hypothetical protein
MRNEAEKGSGIYLRSNAGELMGGDKPDVLDLNDQCT